MASCTNMHLVLLVLYATVCLARVAEESTGPIKHMAIVFHAKLAAFIWTVHADMQARAPPEDLANLLAVGPLVGAVRMPAEGQLLQFRQNFAVQRIQEIP